MPTEAPVAVLAAAPTASPSLGTGDSEGAGRGSGGGVGPGRGDGIGPGTGGGIGGGAFQVGNGVSSPKVLFTPKPLYTSEAMLRRIQGVVELNCVVLATGSVGDCDIVKSLDSNNFGLDNEAHESRQAVSLHAGDQTRRAGPGARTHSARVQHAVTASGKVRLELRRDVHLDRLAQSFHRAVLIVASLKRQRVRAGLEGCLDRGLRLAEMHPRVGLRNVLTGRQAVRVDREMKVARARAARP